LTAHVVFAIRCGKQTADADFLKRPVLKFARCSDISLMHQPTPHMKTWNVGILIFDGVELLDFAGPYEVLAAARMPTYQGFAGWRGAPPPFRVFTIARTKSMIKASVGLGIQADCGFGDHPPTDILIVPGGAGVRSIIEASSDDATLEWVRRIAAAATLTASVCTGAWVLPGLGCCAIAGPRLTFSVLTD
jgi:putative intracellular protease/amidase